MWNRFLHYEGSGVLSGCGWGFAKWGFVVVLFGSVGFCHVGFVRTPSYIPTFACKRSKQNFDFVI